MAATNFNVYFYNFAKKVNSTRTPVNGTEGLLWEVHTCYLRSPSSIIAPVLEMSFDRNQYGGDGGTYNQNIGEAVLEYNYAYIPRFNRYYFINDISWNNGMFILSLVCDVLGSWKEYIGNYNGLILRCSDSNNGMLYDSNKYISGCSTTSASGLRPTISSKITYYVVGTTFSTGSGNGVGGLTYICAAPDKINYYLSQIMNRENWQKIEVEGEIVRPTAEEFVALNPASAIKSVTGVLSNTVPNISREALNFNGYGCIMPNEAFPVLISALSDVQPSVITIAIPKHPEINNDTNKYLLYSPYSEYTLYLPCVGCVPISSYDISDSSEITITSRVDMISASIFYRVTNSNGTILSTYQGNCGSGGGVGATISTGAISALQQSGDAINLVGGLATAGVAAVAAFNSTNPVGIAMNVAMLAGGITNAAQAVNSSIMHGASSASNKTTAVYCGGNQAIFSNYPELMLTYRTLSGGHAKTCGNPYGIGGKVSSHSGYMQIKNPSVDAPATSEELSAINEYLATGFYYEEDVTQQ